MEPSTDLRGTILSPAAIYSGPLPPGDGASGAPPGRDAVSPPPPTWDASPLNPRNRINSLDPVASPTWRLDGVDPCGTVFYALPAFALGAPPLRIDVHIPPQREHPSHLRSVLQSGSAMVQRGGATGRLGIARYVLRALERWSGRMPDFRGKYGQMPFGSHVVVGAIRADVRAAEVQLVPNYDVEQQWWPAERLQEVWGLPWEDWPAIVDWREVRLERQVDGAASLVQLPTLHGSETFVFKSLVRDRKYLYHELRTLMKMPPHPSVLTRPLYVIKKKCRFGGKTGVCGFILPYYPEGSLRDVLTPRRPLVDRLRWARQITDALIHITQSSAGFCSDLRPDSILLDRAEPQDPGSPLRAVLANFEQRDGWYSWTPPEVRYIQYMEQIAVSASYPPVRMEAAALVRAHVPNWTPRTQTDIYRYCPSPTSENGGFSTSWLSLREAPRREAAQVFMLGKLLWCIFEGSSSANCGIGPEMLTDELPTADAPQFPDFRSTPEALRHVIRACTAGAPEWRGRRRSIVSWAGRLVPSGLIGPESGSATAAETHNAAVEWWREEVRDAKAYLMVLSQKVPADDLDAMTEARRRPTLAAVLEDLRRAEEELVGGGASADLPHDVMTGTSECGLGKAT